jgi:hypothetical protein
MAAVSDVRRAWLAERVSRSLRHLLAPDERILAVGRLARDPKADLPRAAGAGWAVSTRAIYCGPFHHTSVERIALESVREVAITAEPPAVRCTIDVLGEPPRQLTGLFAGEDTEVADALSARFRLGRVHDRLEGEARRNP